MTTVRELRAAGADKHSVAKAVREIAEHTVTEYGWERRSLLTGQTDREVVLAELDACVLAGLSEAPEAHS